MALPGLITVTIVMFMFILLAVGWFESDLVVFAALVSLMLFGILTPNEALSGFSNEGILTIAALFVLVSAVQNSKLVRNLPKLIFGKINTPPKAVFRMMLSIATLSSVLNNTPVVAMFTPIIKRWAQDNRFAPSKFLLPLSYAAIFGGMCTLIGTSTNLVVSTFLKNQGYQGFSMFELAYIGVPSTIVGVLYMTFIGQKILPSRNPEQDLEQGESGKYLVEMKVESACPLIGKTIKQAQLRNLKGLYLIAVIRKGRKIFPVSSDEVLQSDDHLIFTGVVSMIFELEKIPGLTLELGSEVDLEHFRGSDIHLSEVVISKNSMLSHRTLKESQFRQRYNAVIIAVFRNGRRMEEKIGTIVLKPGDVLFTLSAYDFLIKNQGSSKDFYFTSHVSQNNDNDFKSHLSLGIFLCMIVSVTIGILPIVTASFVSVAVLLFLKCMTPREARRSIEWNLLILIGSSFGIAHALNKTGAAGYIAEAITREATPFGPVAVLAAVYLLTMLFTEIITNNAAAALVFPIAFSISQQMSLNPEPFAIAIAMAASASFSTPIGYQTNLIVYGPGGYKFSDYLKVGIPLNLLFMIVSIILIPQFWPLQ
ncbi:SLC13 family permease [Siminovitchia acidinfaciens]|uniref:SLC13 family permease n=1 Tax=Siminovitchia acidinfaciens TaxID=2321395 RepID=A0A429Y4M3_9BACI|nr:SLC13 family permease [Siminovitchia acidinfaciens]RST76317.1 SLC13 family permease [Siminovitchia acidinfaciens]